MSNFMKSTQRARCLLLFLILLSSCAHAPRSKVVHPRFKGLKVSLAQDRQPDELTVEKALFFDGALFIKQKSGNKIIYSKGNREEIRVKRRHKSKIQNAPESDFIIHLDQHSDKPWKNLPLNAKEVSLKSSGDWIELMNLFIIPLVPRDGESGIIIDFWTEVEIFFWFNSDTRRYSSSLLQDKPPGIATLGVRSFSNILKESWNAIEDHPAISADPNPRLLFQTLCGKDIEPYSFPFFFLDLEKKQIMAVQFLPDRASNKIYSSSIYPHTINIVKSMLGMINRPFTTLGRSFFFIGDYITDTIRPNSLSRLTHLPIPELNSGSGMDLDAFEKELDQRTSSEKSRGAIDFLVRGEKFFPRFIDVMMNAEKSIDIRLFIFDSDDYALKIADILKDRSSQVNVRVLLDGMATIGSASSLPRYIPKGYEKSFSIKRYLKSGSDVSVRFRPNVIFSLDHTKTIIIDQKCAFLGGMNIGREYRYEWHDLMMEVNGPIVDVLQEKFDRAWAFSGLGGDLAAAWSALAGTKDRNPLSGYPIRALYTRPGGADIFNAQRRAIQRAKKFIFIENPYFADSHIIYELVRARKRGVDVRVILPAENDWELMNYNNIIIANILIANGVRVYLFPEMTHVKAAVYDGWACVGSANFDRASFRLNRELSIATSEPCVVQELLKEVFYPDFAFSRELTEPYPVKWRYYFLKAFASHL
ncbi:phosphatidylserine/phosphatidylglycerophosphate/cardiolipin synthase family protein [Candidatus Sumerlaeota bacterium]|nr:phosphatidylserine/phosphatidylglycerophosphate/cardiolipin synthase family protein [Candidatus Sumerlaeota bacterium]